MKYIKLSAITNSAKTCIDMYGDVWKVVDDYPTYNPSFFKSKTPHFYITPATPKKPANIGARWIAASNDKDFDFVETSPPRIRRDI